MLERSNLENIKKDFTLTRQLLDVYGIIKEVKDGVVIVKDGLDKVGMSEMVEFVNTGIKGIVNYLGSEKSITVLGSMINLKVGDLVKRLNILPYIDVNNNWLGRVVDPLGNTLDGLGEIKNTKDSKKFNIEKKAPGIIERESVKDALETGVKFLDAMIPIGLGQRELIIGDPKTGKSTIAIDTIINQKGKGLICVYVVIGQKQTSLLKILKTLKNKDCMSYVSIVMASAADSAVMQFFAPYSGAAVSEYFMSKGRDVLIVYDDLSKHAVAYRQMSLLLRRPPGREGYPGDVWATVRLYLCMLDLQLYKKRRRNFNSFTFFKKNIRNYTTFNQIKNKAIQINKGFVTLKKALTIYEEESNLKLLDLFGTALFFAGFFSWTICLLDISIFLKPIVWAIIALIEYLLGFIITMYTCIKRLIFIYNYDLDCNPKFIVKMILGEASLGRSVFKSIFYICGGAVTTNFVIDEVTDVSVLREYGKNYVYGDNSFKETTIGIFNKITNSNSDRFNDKD